MAYADYGFCRLCSKKVLLDYMYEGLCPECNRKQSTIYYNYLCEQKPYQLIFNSIKARCNSKTKNPTYKKYYFAKGIKNFLRLKDVKDLWERDKAVSMKKPNIHRKDNNDNYTLENCVFIESSEHTKLHNKQRILN